MLCSSNKNCWLNKRFFVGVEGKREPGAGRGGGLHPTEPSAGEEIKVVEDGCDLFRPSTRLPSQFPGKSEPIRRQSKQTDHQTSA